MRSAFWILPILLTGCFKSTLFTTNPDETDVTRGELAQLAKLEAPSKPWTFVALGDTHDEYDDLETSVGIINRSDARLALIAGDMTDRGLLQEFEWSGELYRELAMPFFTAIGNHDAISDGRTIYGKMYGPYNYSFRYGGLKFVLFESNDLENSAAPDRDWVRAQVADHEGDVGVVLVTHQPLLQEDEVEGGTNHEFYDELLASGDVVLAIHGHLDEQRLRLSHGVPVLQCGTFETTRLHTFVHVDGAGLRFESCKFDDCRDLAPEAEVAR
jgi:3',5'-cyclic-AMP phosphodiesterase